MASKFSLKLKLLMSSFVLLLTLALPPEHVAAQEPWPPFWFDLIPAYENGQLTYRMNLYSRVEWPMPDLAIKIRLPAGARFLEAQAQPGVVISSSEQEVVFFTSAFNKYLEKVFFTLAVTDPTQTVFTTQALITWQGDHQGEYMTDEVSFDITRPILDWHAPAPARLQLGISTTVADNVITYALYPKAIDRQRMWDLTVNVPLPEGVPLLSVEAPATFTTHFDGREVSFFTLELAGQAEVEPLVFKVSTEGIEDPLIITHAWATWKNAGSKVGATVPAVEQLTSDAIVVQPNIPQRIIADSVGDVPLPNYDLTSIAFQETEAAFTVIFNTVGVIGPAGQPVQYTLFVDSDCNSGTGEPRKHRGAEYRINYNHEAGRATLTLWNESAKDWDWDHSTRLDSLIEPKLVAILIPYHLIGQSREFCWIARAEDSTETYNFDLPTDWLPNEEFLNLTRYEPVQTPPNPISGKISVPLNNKAGFYDVAVFALPGGQEIARIANARQPNFHMDGQRLLINHESTAAENVHEQNYADGRTAVYVLKNYNATENIYEYNLADGTEKRVSDGGLDSHPFYNSDGNRVVYGNPAFMAETDEPLSSFLFVQCSLLPPEQEVEPGCRELPQLGILMPAQEADQLWGSYPVWISNNMIAYNGCVRGAETTACGIYLVSADATQSSGEGATPLQLTTDSTDIPADTQDNWLTFTSRRDGNWEAYLLNLDGNGVTNLSNNPGATDGLPTISPDGQWVAFVSDRQGSWAIWAVSIAGGPAQKLFDLPTDTPWGQGDRAWINERISWGK